MGLLFKKCAICDKRIGPREPWCRVRGKNGKLFFTHPDCAREQGFCIDCEAPCVVNYNKLRPRGDILLEEMEAIINGMNPLELLNSYGITSILCHVTDAEQKERKLALRVILERYDKYLLEEKEPDVKLRFIRHGRYEDIEDELDKKLYEFIDLGYGTSIAFTVHDHIYQKLKEILDVSK